MASGGYKLGPVQAGEWIDYPVNVAGAGIYTLDVQLASTGAGGAFRVEVNGIIKTGSLLSGIRISPISEEVPTLHQAGSAW